MTPFALVTVPIELVLGGAVMLILPASSRRVVAVALGVLLGVLSLVKLLDLGFYTALARPFDPVLDLALLDDAVRLLTAASGRTASIGAAILAVAAAVATVAVSTLAVQRLTAAVVRRREASTRLVTVAALGWLTLWLAGVQLAPGIPLAASGETSLASTEALGVVRGVSDRRNFEREAAVDAYASVPGDQLLTALRGRDVLLVFVESYGRSALTDPRIDVALDRSLDRGTRSLSAAGFGSRSAYLTSSTAGGGSWLAQGTLLSGLWVDNQSRYQQLVASDRLTLPRAFARAGWRTVAVAPGTTRAWPESAFYGYQGVYDAAALDYHGPSFSWAAMPDQYTLAEFERLERSAPHPPLMAVVPLVSSHAPWAPVPTMVDWSVAGDSATYASMAGPNDPPEAILTRDPDVVRADYARAVDYSMQSVVSYLRRYGDENLVAIILGDHQPSPVVTGTGAGRDVPITIVSKDRSVISRIGGWRWSPGLRPAAEAPVWRMDAFRDRFLAAFGPPASGGQPH
ncbi:MAG TPA: sulfatase-like hydrolase/transferase [Microlunatus sp.]|nr:sulfatase-like hydrolase/transferase [Microlunatus sp.]